MTHASSRTEAAPKSMTSPTANQPRRPLPKSEAEVIDPRLAIQVRLQPFTAATDLSRRATPAPSRMLHGGGVGFVICAIVEGESVTTIAGERRFGAFGAYSRFAPYHEIRDQDGR
jgi:hypothetical protein